MTIRARLAALALAAVLLLVLTPAGAKAEGPHMDPNGWAANGDAGPHMDPDGTR